MQIKKLTISLSWLFMLLPVNFPTTIFAFQQPCPPKLSSVSALLMDANSDQIVYSQNPHQRLQPASLAKVMTLFVIFDALEQGLIKFDDEVVISSKAAQKEGSKMYLREGEKIPFVELIKGIAVVSGNDACVAAAEGIYGSERDFVEKMNQKLRDLNLQDSKFQTVDGWPVAGQYTTAHDMVMISHAYIREHPEALAYHKLKEFIHADIVLHNRNGLILQDPSVDGLKTGHVEESGYHLIATAQREDRRYVAVIMGSEKIEVREKEARQLLDFGFDNFTTMRLFNKGDVLSYFPVAKGAKNKVGLKPVKDGVVTTPKGLKDILTYDLKIPKGQQAPIEMNQTMGEVIISYRKEILKEIPLITDENIDRADTKTLAMKSIMSTVVRQKIALAVMFVLLSIIGIQFLYIRRLRRRVRNKDSNGNAIVKQRLDKLLKTSGNDKTDS